METTSEEDFGFLGARDGGGVLTVGGGVKFFGGMGRGGGAQRGSFPARSVDMARLYFPPRQADWSQIRFCRCNAGNGR